jgi:hypothetical protein
MTKKTYADLTATTTVVATDLVATYAPPSGPLKKITADNFFGPGSWAIRGLTPAADKLAYFTGASAAALADLTAFGRALIGAAITPTNDDLLQYKTGAWTNRTPTQVKADMNLSLISNDRISVNTSDVGSRLQVYTSPGDGSSASGLYVEHYNSAAGAYGIESRVFPTCYGNVTHHYSDQGPAWQMDNVGNQSILVLANAENGAVRPGVKGTGAFISFVGYGVATPTVRSTLGYISPSLQFASNEPGNQWTFVNGVSLLAGLTETNRALTVTSLNTGYNSTFYGKINGPYMATDTDGGVALTIAKTSVGGGVGQSIINLGTGESLTMSNSGGRTAGFAANGYLGIGTVGGTYGIAVSLATANTALFASSGANHAQLRIDTGNTSQRAVVVLGSGFSTKWTFGKDTDDSFYIQQNAGAKVFQVSAASVVTLASTDASVFVSATSTGVLTLGASGKAVTLGNGNGAVTVGGTAAVVTLGSSGTVQFDTSSTVGWTGRTLLSSSADGVFGISNNAVSAYAYLAAETTNALSIRNSTNAQTLRVYNTYTDASNYERGEVTFSGNILKIQTAAAGTGTARAIQFGVGGTQWGINTSGHFVALANNAFDIGVSGTATPRTVYAGTSVVAPYVRTTATTVAALPAAATAAAGARAFVTDATATTFLSTVAGGGANKVPVVSDGTNWLIG